MAAGIIAGSPSGERGNLAVNYPENDEIAVSSDFDGLLAMTNGIPLSLLNLRRLYCNIQGGLRLIVAG